MNLTFELAQFAGVGAGLLGMWGVVQLLSWFKRRRPNPPVAEWLAGMDTLLNPTSLEGPPLKVECGPNCALHPATWNRCDD